MRSKLAINGVVAGLGLSIGFVLGKLVTVPGISCAKELDPLQALSIAVTLFVAVFFGVILSRRDRMNDIEKNLIIEKLGRIDETLGEYLNKIADGDLSHSSASSFRKKVSGTFKCVWKEAGIDKFKEARQLTEYETEIAEIHSLLTWTEACDECGTHVPDVKVKDGKMVFSLSRIALLETKIGALRNELFTLQIKVNAH